MKTKYMYRHITVKVKITFIILFQVVKNWRFKKKNPTTGLSQFLLLTNVALILLQIVTVWWVLGLILWKSMIPSAEPMSPSLKNIES